MLCENCHRQVASVHLTEINSDQSVEIHLCEQCVKEKDQLIFINTISVSDLFNGLLGFPNAGVTNVPKGKACSKCGMTFEGFQKTGKMGCGECYTFFGDKISPLLKKVHGGVSHTGKTPLSFCKLKEPVTEALKKKLEDCIKAENYEEAANIRDEIRKLQPEN